MKVTIIGAGNTGRGLGTRVAAGGLLRIAVQQPLDLGFASAIKLHPGASSASCAGE